MILYRGTKGTGEPMFVGGPFSIRKVKKPKTAPSFTDALPVALIWSAIPGDPWSSNKERRKSHFVDTSRVEAVKLLHGKVLDLRPQGNYTSLYWILKALGYGKNKIFTIEEALKVYNYLHNRIIGKAVGGEFKYKVLDEDENEVDDDEVPLSFRNPQTTISYFARTDFEGAPGIDTAANIVADTFIFVDSPAVQRVATALGYKCIVYEDVFGGGEYAAPELLGTEVEDLPGVKMEEDIDWDEVPVHNTYRPLTPDAVQPLWTKPAEEVLKTLKNK
jgi:hypothetical protein